jgi:glycosyltransferase involved in cell wall biosynthesis
VRVAINAPAKTAAAVLSLRGSRSPGVSLKNLAVVPKALWLAEVAARWKANHIHCHWGGTTATMALLASKLSGIPWSLTVHRWDIVENNLLANKIQSASFTRFISEDGLRMARALGVVSDAKVGVLRMGVALPSRTIDRKRPGNVVLCPARLVEVKGHRFLLEAWRILKNRGVAGELWLAGDGELRPQLMSLAKALGLLDSVKFLGAVPHAKLLQLYEAGMVAAVALASIDLGHGYHEGIPVALIEAMSYGIPVVSTETGGTPELVVPGTGLLVPAKDAGALANALHSLLPDDCLSKQLGESGRRRAMESHDIVRVAAELARAFEAVREQPATAAQHTERRNCPWQAWDSCRP